MGQLWNIGTQDDPIIQGQAGKPFYHQMGPLLQFHNPDQQVDNKCLCKYRYARYFAFYSNVLEDKEDIVFYKDFNNVQRDQSGSQVVFRDYSTESSSGYSWQLLSGPHYLGCYPVGTFTTGKWFPVDLPYDAPSGSASGNFTAPSPSYIHIYKQEDYHSLLCMIVSSYKCCNGEVGCGTQISRGSDSWVPLDHPAAAAQYLVTGLDKESADQCTAELIKGTEQCICTPPYRVQRKFKQLDCSRAIIRVWYGEFLIPSQLQHCTDFCPEWFQQLPQLAITTARAEVNTKCVWWLLWKWTLPGDCDECAIKELQPVFIQDPQQWAYISSTYPEVYGKGSGWMPKKFHDPQKRWDFCNPQGGGVSYQWTYIEVQPQDVQPEALAILIAAASPGPLKQSPCKDYCFLVGNVGNISDSLSGATEIPQDQLPCNTPDPSGKTYKKFTHQFFNIWTLPVQKVDTPDDPSLDPCYDTYKLAGNAFVNGQLQWTALQIAAIDYQLQQKGYFKGTQFLYVDKRNGQARLPLDIADDPPTSPQDPLLKDLFNMEFLSGNVYIQDYSRNHCGGVYQIYLFDCVCSDSCTTDCAKRTNPYINSGTCSKWKYIGQVSREELKQRGCCVGGWTYSTVDNTFSDPVTGPVGWCVYTVVVQEPYYCADYPQGPKKKYYYRYGVVTPHEEHNHLISWEEPQYIEWEYCASNSTVFVPGFKTVQDPLDEQNVIEPVEGVIDISSDSLCQLYYYEVYSPFVDDCYEFPSDSRSFFQGLRIQWNLPYCQQWKLYIKYFMTSIQLGCDNWHTGGFDPEGQQWECKRLVMDAVTEGGYKRPDSSQLTWGWTSNSNPMTTEALQVDENYVVTPPQGKCEVFYLHKLSEFWGSSDSAPSQDCDSDSPPTLNPPYTIAWDASECLDLTKYVRYRAGTFEPSCSNSAGRAITDHWQTEVYQMAQSADDPVSGWRRGQTPAAQELVVMTDGTSQQVLPGDLCKIWYIQILQIKVDCGEPQTWSNSLPVPQFPNTYIDWNRCKCLQAGRTVVWADASVQRSCNTVGGNSVTWGAISSHNCNSTGRGGYQPPAAGWFDVNGNTALDIINNVVQPLRCSALYRAIIYDGQTCGPSTWSIPQSIKNSVQNQSVAWPESCYNHYVHYMAYQYTGECGTRVASLTNSYISAASTTNTADFPTAIQGWKYTRDLGAAAMTKPSGAVNSCSFYYIYPFSSYSACNLRYVSPPPRPTSASLTLNNIIWPSSCYPGKWYMQYWYAPYSKGCEDPAISDSSFTYGVASGDTSFTQSTTGWYSGTDPMTAQYIPAGTSISDCGPLYYIVTKAALSSCGEPASSSVPTYTLSTLNWPSSCGINSWYQDYWYAPYSKGCDPVPKTFTNFTSATYSAQNSFTSKQGGWFKVHTPAGTRISEGGTTDTCDMYFIVTGPVYNTCTSSSVGHTIPSGYTVYSIEWPTSCCPGLDCSHYNVGPLNVTGTWQFSRIACGYPSDKDGFAYAYRFVFANGYAQVYQRLDYASSYGFVETVPIAEHWLVRDNCPYFNIFGGYLDYEEFPIVSASKTGILKLDWLDLAKFSCDQYGDKTVVISVPKATVNITSTSN